MQAQASRGTAHEHSPPALSGEVGAVDPEASRLHQRRVEGEHKRGGGCEERPSGDAVSEPAMAAHRVAHSSEWNRQRLPMWTRWQQTRHVTAPRQPTSAAPADRHSMQCASACCSGGAAYLPFRAKSPQRQRPAGQPPSLALSQSWQSEPAGHVLEADQRSTLRVWTRSSK